jgi:hypothetical protein
MIGHAGGLLERAAILSIRRDTGGPKAVVADSGRDTSGLGAPLDHAVGLRLREGRLRELFGAAADGAEQRPLGIVADAGLVDVGREVGFEVVVAGHGVGLAAFSRRRTHSRRRSV